MKVIPLKHANEIVGPRYYDLLTVADLSAMPAARYRVKSILPRDGLAAIFGPPGSAKTFLALNLAFAISEGDEWFGYRVEPCSVLYVCLEGQGGLPQRMQTYAEYHGAQGGKRLRFITEPFSLLLEDDLSALVRTINNSGLLPKVIVLDTFSAASAGADENSSADMGKLIEAAKRIREECGGLVILVHHSGKDATKGLRGHSSLSAALDVVIHVTRNDERRSWELAKSKDGADGKEHPFQLSTVELGVDKDGDPITSCVIVPGERGTDSSAQIKRPKSGNQKIVYEVIGELLRKATYFGEGGAPASHPCIRVDEVIPACRGRLLVAQDRVPERVRLAITGLINSGSLMLREHWLWHR